MLSPAVALLRASRTVLGALRSTVSPCGLLRPAAPASCMSGVLTKPELVLAWDGSVPAARWAASIWSRRALARSRFSSCSRSTFNQYTLTKEQCDGFSHLGSNCTYYATGYFWCWRRSQALRRCAMLLRWSARSLHSCQRAEGDWRAAVVWIENLNSFEVANRQFTLFVCPRSRRSFDGFVAVPGCQFTKHNSSGRLKWRSLTMTDAGSLVGPVCILSFWTH